MPRTPGEAVVAITGASSGIGRPTALRRALLGAALGALAGLAGAAATPPPRRPD